MEKINPGDFDTKVAIQLMVQTIGSQGQKTWTPSLYSYVYGKIERNVDESVSDGNLESGQSIRLTTYKIDSLTTRWRVLIGSDPYEIRSIDPISRMSRFFILDLYAIR